MVFLWTQVIAGVGNPLNLNPNDIESFSILKDALLLLSMVPELQMGLSLLLPKRRW
jgi:hypothetical protein